MRTFCLSHFSSTVFLLLPNSFSTNSKSLRTRPVRRPVEVAPRLRARATAFTCRTPSTPSPCQRRLTRPGTAQGELTLAASLVHSHLGPGRKHNGIPRRRHWSRSPRAVPVQHEGGRACGRQVLHGRRSTRRYVSSPVPSWQAVYSGAVR